MENNIHELNALKAQIATLEFRRQRYFETAEAEIARLDAHNAKQGIEYDELHKEYTWRGKEIARLNDQLDEFNKALDSTLAERREALDRAFELEKELDRAQQEVLRLKAQLYDLMTAK